MKNAFLLALAVGFSGCASYDKEITAHRAAYGSDTLLQERMLEPLRLEPQHGQVTVAVTRKFAEKILAASLKPNQLVVAIGGRGRAWKSDGKRLGVSYDNGVWLEHGEVTVNLAASELALEDDTVKIHTHLEGRGEFTADLRFFGITLTREVELALLHDEPLALKLLATPAGWVLQAVGAPLHAEVRIQLPAATLAGVDLYEVKIARTLELELAQLPAWQLPLPAPREVDVGPEKVRVGLTNYKFGADAGRLWLGADLTVEGAEPPKPAAN